MTPHGCHKANALNLGDVARSVVYIIVVFGKSTNFNLDCFELRLIEFVLASRRASVCIAG